MTWKWWEFWKKIKVDWIRYRKSVAANKRRKHYEYVNYCPAYRRRRIYP